MPRRLPTLAPLALAAAVGLFALTSALTAQAPKPADPPTAADPLKSGQEESFELYKKFSDKLLELAQKWEKSDNPEDKARAETIRTALKIAEERGVKNLFKDLVEGLASPNQSGGNIRKIIGQDEKLVAALREVLRTLQSEDEATKLARQIADLNEAKKIAERIKRALEVDRALIDNPKTDGNRISKDLNDQANNTKDLANRLGNKDAKENKGDQNKGGNAGEKPDPKSEPKAEAKPGENALEAKPDTGEDKSTGKEPSAGDTPPKGSGEPKPSDGNGMPPEAAAEKPSPKEPNAGAKGMNDPKPKSGEPNPKSGDPKSGEPKAGEQPKPSDSQSKNQGEGKAESKPADPKASQGKPMGGKESSDSQASAKPPSPGSQSPPGQPSQGNPQPKKDPLQKGLEDAVPPQEGAAQDLKKNQRDDASKKTDDAIQKLEDVIKELEKRLAQLRDKEKLKKLENLEQRIARMLSQQIEVRDATKQIEDRVKATKQKTTAEVQKAQAQADKEQGIIAEADKAMQLIEGDGSAVVFAGVLNLVRQDMQAIFKQLERSDTGEATLLLEDQVISQLQKMLEALKKAQQDLKNPPPPPPPGQPPPPNQGNQSLIKLIEQLKLLRELQVQVNDRTVAFGKLAQGEQAADPFLQDQLKQLGDRQKMLQDMLHKIASGEIQ